MTEREVTIVKTRSTEMLHLCVEAIGGYYLGYPWLMPEQLAIYYIKNNVERYFVKINGRKTKLVIGNCENKEYLLIEGDNSWPEKIVR